MSEPGWVRIRRWCIDCQAEVWSNACVYAGHHVLRDYVLEDRMCLPMQYFTDLEPAVELLKALLRKESHV